MSGISQQFRINPAGIFSVFAVFTLISAIMAIAENAWYLYALPMSVIFGLFVVKYFRQTYLLLWFLIPLSIEYELSSSLATDLPTEPFIVLLMGATILFALANPNTITRQLLNHPVTTILCLHVVWIGITAFFSQQLIVSGKFFVSKIWYIVVFYFLTSLLIRNEKQFKPIFWCVAIPLCFVIIQSVIRHAMLDFEFQEVNKTLTPFFRNHVNYAVMIAVVFPIAVHARTWYKSGSLERLLVHLILFVFLTGIVFAYTRAAYLSVLLIPVIYFIFAKRLTKWIAALSLFAILLLGVFMANDNRYLSYAPDYESTIYHEDLEDHIIATFEGKDVSSMERIYRWIAAARMCADRPLVGFGPGNFYSYYRYYTIDNFETYVSDNIEQSGVHNYFLMTLVDQGIIGLALFLAFCLSVLIAGEYLYRRSPPEQKRFVMTLLISFAIILLNITLGDLIEVDKIGSFFFMIAALIVNFSISSKNKEANLSLPEETNHP
ncbi:MAG: O-antigen ligase family protein [Sphingobacteriales bacterium]|nr:MAG: O-antigen ligase family protein [Sphingobacteriales bacterium]